jgi:hypothetical protein
VHLEIVYFLAELEFELMLAMQVLYLLRLIPNLFALVFVCVCWDLNSGPTALFL